jgi:hypothetical protein
MRFILHATTLCTLLAAQAIATGSGLFTANGVELQEYRFAEEIMYGEPVSILSLCSLRAVVFCFTSSSCKLGEY